jgi:hypothetical protein
MVVLSLYFLCTVEVFLPIYHHDICVTSINHRFFSFYYLISLLVIELTQSFIFLSDPSSDRGYL